MPDTKQKPTDLMTRGFQALVGDSYGTALTWAMKAKSLMKFEGPDFAVGRVAEGITMEDEGRTLVLPWPGVKVFASYNETGGITFMLAEEY